MLVGEHFIPDGLKTAFLDISEFRRNIGEIAWESEVWLADSPDHMIHCDVESFWVNKGANTLSKKTQSASGRELSERFGWTNPKSVRENQRRSCRHIADIPDMRKLDSTGMTDNKHMTSDTGTDSEELQNTG